MLPSDYYDVFENPHPLLLPSDDYRKALQTLDLDAFRASADAKTPGR